MDEVERHYNQHVLKPITVILICAVGAFAQDAPKAETPKQEEKKTEVRINMLNVCTPSEAEQQEIKAALDRIPKRAVFTPDFEVSRGRATMEEASASRYLRLRRELDSKTGFNTAQYSISTDADKMTEKLVMKVANPKDLLQITLEDRVTYTYLVNEHWSSEAKYTFVNAFDPELSIAWPISKEPTSASRLTAD